jgi:hypothetical protein
MKKFKNLLKGTIMLGVLTGVMTFVNVTTVQAATYTETYYVNTYDKSKGTATRLIEDEDITLNGDYAFRIVDGFLKKVEPIDATTQNGDVVIPNSVKVIDSKSLELSWRGESNYNQAMVKKITIPDTVIAIDSRAIINTDITELTIPSSVEYIGVRAISDNDKLETIVINEGCTHIDMYAFEGCTSLKEAYLPTTINKMSYNWTDANPFWKIEKQVTVYAKKSSFVYSYCKNILGMTVKDTTPVKPNTVSSFKASKIKSNSLKLNWKKSKNANGYHIYQYANKAWSQIATTDQTNYTVINLNSATTYKFKIVPVNSNKFTTANGKSTVMSTYTKTATPNLTAATKESNKSAILTFDKEATSKNYEVYVSTNGKKYSKVATFKNSSSGKDTYTLKKGLNSGKLNYIKMRCYTTISGKKVYGDYSQVIKVQF